MSDAAITHIKTILLAAALAALGYIAVALGADPVLNADPITGGVIGAVVGIIGRILAVYAPTGDATISTSPAPPAVRVIDDTVTRSEPVLVRPQSSADALFNARHYADTDGNPMTVEEIDPGSIPGAR